MAITLTKITPQHHLSALRWIRAVNSPYQGESGPLTANQAWRIIERLYLGGWAQFVADQELSAPCSWCGTPTDRWELGTPDCGC